MNGMMVTVIRKVTQEPSAPRIPSLLSQNPSNNSAPNSHSETLRNQLAPRAPKTGYISGLAIASGAQGLGSAML